MIYKKGDKKMTIDFIHKDNYGTSLKIADKFTSKSSLRPILQYVSHLKNGTIYATDSHRAIEIKDIHGFEKDYLVHTASLQFATGNYPDVSKILSESTGETVITLDKEQIKIWLQMHRSLNQIARQNYNHRKHVTIEFKDTVNVKIGDENELTINLPYAEYDKQDKVEQISYVPEYMRDCLEAHVKLDSDHVCIKITNELRPVVLDNEVDVKSVLLPVRVY